MFTQSSDAEGDVLFQRHAKLLGAFAHVLARDALGEELVFYAALNGVYFQIQDPLRRAHVSAGGEESRDLVASEQRVLQRGLPRHATIICVRDNRAYDLLGVALLAQNLCSRGGLPMIGREFVLGAALVVEIEKKSSGNPGILYTHDIQVQCTHSRFTSGHV